jgi:hypothetical protein
MATKHFEMALRAVEADPEEEDFITFDFPEMDGTRSPEFKAYLPSPSQFAIAVSATGPRRDLATKLAAIVDFMVEVLDEEGQAYITNRLMTSDRKDPFGLDELTELMNWMVEEWTARPTGRPSGSTRSASRGGPKSRRTTTKRTSSASA